MAEKSNYVLSGATDDKPSTGKLIARPHKNAARKLYNDSDFLEAELTRLRETINKGKANEEQEKSEFLEKDLHKENMKLREALVAIKSEFEGELYIARKDLKKANKKLVLVEQEKESDLKKAFKLSNEENKKLSEALEEEKRDVERLENEIINYHNLKVDAEENEIYLTDLLRRSEEENLGMRHELNRHERSKRKAKHKMKKIILENVELRKREIDLLAKIEFLTSKVDKQDEDYDIVPEWTTNENHEVESADFDLGLDFEMCEIDEKGSYSKNIDEDGEMAKKKKKAIFGKIGSLSKKGSSS
ncbi:hypothetical protein CASFOL_003491 [Castilleja foliolosa]|uniref:Uncharacterized protein n=1 Tax=Castilleja foliolosa TaxID=1961234 RepID=A0ABD3EHN1_9LAMI